MLAGRNRIPLAELIRTVLTEHVARENGLQKSHPKDASNDADYHRLMDALDTILREIEKTKRLSATGIRNTVRARSISLAIALKLDRDFLTYDDDGNPLRVGKEGMDISNEAMANLDKFIELLDKEAAAISLPRELPDISPKSRWKRL